MTPPDNDFRIVAEAALVVNKVRQGDPLEWMVGGNTSHRWKVLRQALWLEPELMALHEQAMATLEIGSDRRVKAMIIHQIMRIVSQRTKEGA